MTALAEHTVTDVPADGALAFAPEHYGCPPWCTANTVSAVNHDSADGMPDWPGFSGYRHWTGLYLQNEADRYGERLSLHLCQDAEAAEPVISVRHSDEVWVEFSLTESAELAETLAKAAAGARGHCPPWCLHDHDAPGDEEFHMAGPCVAYASAPKFENGHANVYGINVFQPAPEIELCDGWHNETVTLTLAEAANVAEAVAELAAAAREDRPVSAAWS